MDKLTKRQLNILEFIKKSGKAGNREIKEYLRNVSRITIVRDLNFLLDNGLIEQKGKGRSVFYEERTKNGFLRYIDIDRYFEKEADKRKLKFKSFNFNIFKNIKDIFTYKELKELQGLNKQHRARIKKLPKSALKKEFERLTIELSWKSSRIEGNTY